MGGMGIEGGVGGGGGGGGLWGGRGLDGSGQSKCVKGTYQRRQLLRRSQGKIVVIFRSVDNSSKFCFVVVFFFFFHATVLGNQPLLLLFTLVNTGSIPENIVW